MSRYVPAMTQPKKRPLLPQEDRRRLRQMSLRAAQHRIESGTNQAYAQGVVDTLRWIVGDDSDMTPMMKQVTS